MMNKAKRARKRIAYKIGRLRTSEQYPVLLLVLTAVILLFVLNLEDADTSTWFAGLSLMISYATVMFMARNIRLTRTMATETRNARLAQSRPQVLVSFERIEKEIVVVVGHYGGGPARNVRFDFVPALRNEKRENIGESPLLATGLPMMIPGERHHVTFGSYYDFQMMWSIDESPEGVVEMPSQFAVTITLEDPLANNIKYTNRYVLDLNHLMSFVRPKWEIIPPDDPRYNEYLAEEGENEIQSEDQMSGSRPMDPL